MISGLKNYLLEEFTQSNQQELVKIIKPLPEKNLIDLYSQVQNFNSQYSGGLQSYCEKARKLAKKTTDLSKIHIRKPTNLKSIDLGTEFELLENSVISRLSETAFVLVAGGLGERLGFPGIKVSIFCEFSIGQSFLEHYLEHLKTFSILSNGCKVNLLIMTSTSNHRLTVEFINALGLQKRFEQHVNIILQSQSLLMFCFKDTEGNLDYIFKEDKLLLIGKPYGHGEIHKIIKELGILTKWKKQGVRCVCFFQDTNPFSLKTFAVKYGYMVKHNLAFLFSGIRRKPGESSGILVENERGNVFNIEYNIFNQLEEAKDDQSNQFVSNINNFLIQIDE